MRETKERSKERDSHGLEMPSPIYEQYELLSAKREKQDRFCSIAPQATSRSPLLLWEKRLGLRPPQCVPFIPRSR